MPRRRSAATSPLKRPLDDEDDKAVNGKRTRNESGPDTPEVGHSHEIICEVSQAENDSAEYLEIQSEEQHAGDVCIGGRQSLENEKDDTEPSTSQTLSASATPGQRNLSLEALFQVTDTELQAISKQSPNPENQVFEISESGQAILVLDGVIQDREELVEESEVVHQDLVKIPVSETGVEKYQLKSDSLEKQGLKLVYTKQTGDSPPSQSSPEPSTSSVDTTEDSAARKQFSNIERILQKAGIDTSCKTWKTLTRPGRHICPYCQRGCAKPSVLEKHIRAHTGERPYPCLVCGFSFKTKSNLYKHCKSRAHVLKMSMETKRAQSQGSSMDSDMAEEYVIGDQDYEGDQLELRTSSLVREHLEHGTSTDSGEEGEMKKQAEHAQKHVLQEVVKYLEKGKEQRPNEVQTERQRAKLERLKSLQDKGGGLDVKRRIETKPFYRQFSLPTMSSKGSQFQPIAPKGLTLQSSESIDSRHAQEHSIYIPNIILSESGKIIQSSSAEENIFVASPIGHQGDKNSGSNEDQSYYNQIEIVNLPDPDTDPETATKALRDLEELSEKFSKATKDGVRLSTSVQSLPDKRVQVMIQLQQPIAQTQQTGTVIETFKEKLNEQPAVAQPRSSVALKERIQQLISANAAIVDTPKVEPPRAKSIKRNLSRQDSESAQAVKSENEAAVSGLLMPNINSVPLQPLPTDGDNGNSASESPAKTEGFRNVIVERIEQDGECILVVEDKGSDSDSVEDVISERNFRVSPLKLRDATLAQQLSTGSDSHGSFTKKDIPNDKVPTRVQVLHENYSRSVSQQAVRHSQFAASKANSLPVRGLGRSLHRQSPVSVMSHTASLLGKRSASDAATEASPMILIPKFPSVDSGSSVIKTKSQLDINSTVPTQPGQLGKMALRNLQMRSKSISSVSSTGAMSTGQASTSVIMSNKNPAQSQFVVKQSPVATQVQSIAHSKNRATPLLQSVPVLLVDQMNSPAVQPQQPSVILQPQQPAIARSSYVTLIQSPSAIPVIAQHETKSNVINIIQNQPILVQPHAQHTSPIVATPPKISMVGSPMTAPQVQTGSATDPMKILSSIVSNTMGQQRLENQSSTSQPQEIKIEIKLPQPQQTVESYQVISKPSATTRGIPVLKRQNSIFMPTVPSPSSQSKVYSKPLFRFQAPSTSVAPVYKSTPQLATSPVFRFQTARTKSVGDQVITQTSQVTDPEVIKELLMKGFLSTSSRPESVHASVQGTNQSTGIIDPLPYQCRSCGTAFKKKETLNLHEIYYCKQKRSISVPSSLSLQTTKSDAVNSEAVAKMFTKKNVPSITHVEKADDGTQIIRQIVVKPDLIFENYEPPLWQRKTSKRRNGKETNVVNQAGQQTSGKILADKDQKSYTETESTTSSSKEEPTYAEKMKTLEEKLSRAMSGRKNKEIWQTKLKGQILKRKLKGKLLMKRSFSMDAAVEKYKKHQIPNSIGLKTRFAEVDMCSGSNTNRKPWMQRSKDDSAKVLGTRKRPLFRRSESVPVIPKVKKLITMESEDREDVGSDSETISEKKVVDIKPVERSELLVSVPVMTAQSMLMPRTPAKPIYQQNYRMKMFTGMGTPVHLVPSATLTPHSELIEGDNVHKRFSFDCGLTSPSQSVEKQTEDEIYVSKSAADESVAVVSESSLKADPLSPTKAETKNPKSLAMTPKSPIRGSKSPVLSQSILKVSRSLSVSQSPSTPSTSPIFRPLSFRGHSYPSLRSITHSTFCSADRLQPNYVVGGRNKKVSMYSNWCIAQQNQNPLGLPTRKLLSLYNSRYTSNPVWAVNCGSDPKGGVITHSSYWRYKQAQAKKEGKLKQEKKTNSTDKTDVDEIKTNDKERKGVAKYVQGGYKSLEAYVYIRGRGRGRYVCDTCGIRCKKPSMLKKHIRTHTDLRPYKCKYCKFQFKTKGNLTKHMKSKSHHKKCVELGIIPVPTTVDESQIDTEALQAQCNISKRAQIADYMTQSTEEDNDEGEDDDEEDDDENDSNTIDDEEDGKFEESMDVDVNIQVTDDAMSDKSTTDQSTSTVPDMEGPSKFQLRNEFLQTLGIIAKHVVTTESTVPMATHITSTDSGTSQPIPTVKEEGQSAIKDVPTSLAASSLSTVYGKFIVDVDEDISSSKDNEIIWGLLNLAAQRLKPKDSGAITEETATEKETAEDDSKDQNVDQVSSFMSVTEPSKDVQITVPLGGYVPPMVNMVFGSTANDGANLTRGPIVGQIIRNIDDSKSKTSEQPASRTESMFVPFQFLHPFPGTEAVIMSPKKPESGESLTLTSSQNPQTHASVIVTPSSVQAGQQLIENSVDGSQSSKPVWLQVGTLPGQMGTIQAQIVSIDPAMFKPSPESQTEISGVTELPMVQLQRVSDSVFAMVSSQAEDFERKTQETSGISDQSFTSTQAEILTSVQTSDHVTSTDQVTQTPDHVTETGSQEGRFACTLCSSTFPEHHQLILHGNLHLMEKNKIKCDKCNLKFRSHSTYEKHLLSDLHLGESQGEAIVPTTDNPRPFKCDLCDIAFRMRGHLTKHFRSRSHFINLETLGKLPFGTWSKLEHKVADLEASNLEGFLKKVQILLCVEEKGANLASLGELEINSNVENSQSVSQEQELIPDDYESHFSEQDLERERVKVEMNRECIEIRSIGQDEGESSYTGNISEDIKSDMLFEASTIETIPTSQEIISEVEISDGNIVIGEPMSLDSVVLSEPVCVVSSCEPVIDKMAVVTGSDGSTVSMNIAPMLSNEANNLTVLPESADTAVGSKYENEKVMEEKVIEPESPAQVSVQLNQVPSSSSSSSQQDLTRKIKPHICGLCRKGYSTMMQLKNHLITHAELRPYVCEYCDAGFTNAQSLKIHLNTHTQEAPYVCGVCGQKFVNSEVLWDHCRNQHSNNLLIETAPFIGSVQPSPSCKSPSSESEVKVKILDSSDDVKVIEIADRSTEHADDLQVKNKNGFDGGGEVVVELEQPGGTDETVVRVRCNTSDMNHHSDSDTGDENNESVVYTKIEQGDGREATQVVREQRERHSGKFKMSRQNCIDETESDDEQLMLEEDMTSEYQVGAVEDCGEIEDAICDDRTELEIVKSKTTQEDIFAMNVSLKSDATSDNAGHFLVSDENEEEMIIIENKEDNTERTLAETANEYDLEEAEICISDTNDYIGQDENGEQFGGAASSGHSKEEISPEVSLFPSLDQEKMGDFGSIDSSHGFDGTKPNDMDKNKFEESNTQLQ